MVINEITTNKLFICYQYNLHCYNSYYIDFFEKPFKNVGARTVLILNTGRKNVSIVQFYLGDKGLEYKTLGLTENTNYASKSKRVFNS